MRILLSGASGFVGSEVFSYFHLQGHEVIPLSRGDSSHSTSDHIFWDPIHPKFELASFEGFDAVIHLAGEPIFGIWTEAKKERIRLSRVTGTRLLADIFSRVNQPPKVLLSASAVGYYGDRGEELLQENSGTGNTFLASVCRAWESASDGLQEKGVRVLTPRFGIVIDKRGGVLKKMLLPFKLGLGSIFGSGKQWISWIALNDLVRAMDFCITNTQMEGAINFVSPNPLRQKEFAKTVARWLRRPLLFRCPAFILRKILGQMADELLLTSQRVKPEKLVQHHFSFLKPTLEEAIR